MANKTITQLDAAQSLNDNMVIAVQDTNTTYKTTLADVKAYCVGGPNIQSLSVTPTTSSQTITASGGVDGYSPISVSAVTNSIDANITAGNIKNGVSILGVTGNYTGGDGGLPTGLAIFDIPHGSFNIECDNLDWGSWAQQNVYRISVLVDTTQQIIVGVMLYNNLDDILSFGYDNDPYYLNIGDSTYEDISTYNIVLGFYDHDMGDINSLVIVPGPVS